MKTTVEELIIRLEKFPKTEVIYYDFGRKEDLQGFFTEGSEISDEHWESFAEHFLGDWEYARDTLNDIMPQECLCNSCELYDYEALQVETDEISGQVCRKCGEEEDLLEIK